MTLKSKVRYWTLFCPKYCAASGVAPPSASAASAATNVRRMRVILPVEDPRGRPPGRLPRDARAGRTRATRGGTRAPRNPRNRAAPTGPAATLRRDAARSPWAPGPSSGAPPCPHMRVRRPGRNDEVIGRSGEPPQVQHHGLLGFAIHRGLGHEPQRVRSALRAGARGLPPWPVPASHSGTGTRLFRSPPPTSFLYHVHHDLGSDVRVDLDADLEVAQRADRLGQVDLPLVHVQFLFREPALDIARRDRAVELVLFPDLHGEAELDAGEPLGLRDGRLLLGEALLGQPLRFVGDPLLVGLGGRVGEPLGQEIVARVAVLYLHDLARAAEVLHVLSQDDLHRDPFDRYAAALRRRRNSSQVSVTPRVASPGTRNSSGTASTAEMAPHTKPPPGSKATNSCGSSPTRKRIAPLAWRVASQCRACHAVAPPSTRASASAAIPPARLDQSARPKTPLARTARVTARNAAVASTM